VSGPPVLRTRFTNGDTMPSPSRALTTHTRRFARTRRTIDFLLLSTLVGILLFVAPTGNASAQGPRPHAVRHTPDVVPPTKPTRLAKRSATKTSVSLTWTAGTDDVRVAGYTVYLSGRKVATTTSTRYTVPKLKCGKSYTLAIDAYDAARNHSARARATTWTSRCWVPSLATLTRLTTTVYPSGTSLGAVNTPGRIVSPVCPPQDALAFDSAGNHSLWSSIFAVTAGCPDTTPPTVSITGPAAGATVSGTVSVVASVSDDVAVGSVEFWIDGVNRATDATAPYSYSWDTTAGGDGSHTILVKAFDSSGNSASASITVTASNSGSCVTSSTGWQNQSLAAQSGSFSVGFDATPNGNNIDAVTGLSKGAATGYESLAVIVRFNTAGFIDARNGGDYASAGPIPYTAGTSYHFRLVVNLATHTYSAYVTPKGSGETTLGVNYAFRSEQSSVTSLTNWAVKDETGAAEVCRLVVSSASDSTPPSQPTGLTKSGSTLTSLSLVWAASSDDVGVAGYTVFVNGARVGTTTTTSYTASGLLCGTSYTVAVDAYDAAGNHSIPANLSAATAACSTGGSSAPSTANVFVSPTGSDSGARCVRSATALAFPSDATSVCKSFDQAVTIAAAGDTILAAGGSYGGQKINQHPKASAVSLYVVAGQTASIAGDLSVATDHLDLYGPFAISGGVSIANSDQTSFLAHHDSINNFSATNGYIKASHVLMKDGTIGPYHACLGGGEDGLLVGALYPSWTPSSYVTLDNVTVHDVDRWINPSVGAASGTCTVHTDGIQTFGADHLTIRNCHIYRTATSLIMSKPESGGEIEDNVTIENCMFGPTLEGGNGVLIGASGAPCFGTNTFLIQNNTFAGLGLRLGCSGAPAIVRSNTLPIGSCSGIDQNGTYSYNVFAVGTIDTACIGSSHAKVCNPVYSDPNRATTGDYSRSAFDTCATDAGDPANFPATDIFGRARDLGTAPDAAADEH
jgi:chitodextrinase